MTLMLIISHQRAKLFNQLKNPTARIGLWDKLERPLSYDDMSAL